MEKSTLWIFLLELCIVRMYSMYQCPEICECLPLEDSVICSHNDLAEVPDGICSEVLSIDLSYNQFDRIPIQLSQFQNLTDVNLSHNNITVLEKNSMKELYNLKKIDLSHNKILRNNTSSFAFASLNKLSYLNLGYNLFPFPIQFVSWSIQVLDYTNCSIQELSNDMLKHLTALKELRLSNNKIEHIKSILKSNTLEKLYLNSCDLKSIRHESFINLRSIKELYLKDNYQLQEFNCECKSLEYLDLSNCVLSEVPQSNFPNLVRVNFQGNRLRHLKKDSFVNFSFLKYIDLSRNIITTIDKNAFRNMDSITSINLSLNPITKIDPNIFNTNFKLIQLNLSHTYLKEVPFFNIESIKLLDLSDCEIEKFHSGSLYKMPMLRFINLSKNLITYIPDNLDSTSLESLNLEYCRIESNINKYTFKKLTNLRDVKLLGNRLSNTFNTSYFYKVENIYLSENLWKCDCNTTTFQFFHDYLKTIAVDYDQLKCHYPDYLRDHHWEEACSEFWRGSFIQHHQNWVIGVGMVLAMCAVLGACGFIRRAYRKKEEERLEVERTEARQRLLRMRLESQRVRQLENRNAPDPRAMQSPPSYDEAILLPRIDGSTGKIISSTHNLTHTQSNSINENDSGKSVSSESEEITNGPSTSSRSVPTKQVPLQMYKESNI